MYSSSDGRMSPWDGRGQPLLSRDYVGALELRVRDFLWKEEGKYLESLKSYLKLHPLEMPHDAEAVGLLARLLVMYNIPFLHLSPEGAFLVCVINSGACRYGLGYPGL